MRVDAYRPGRLAVDGRARRKAQEPARVPSHGRRVVLGVSAAGLAAVAVPAALMAALNSDYVRVHDIEVKGNRFLTDREVAEIAGIEGGENLFSLDLTGAKEALGKDPRIKEASVGRVFPDRVVVEVEEKRAVGSVVVAGGVYKIARDGTILEELTREYEDLPHICGIEMDAGGRDIIGMRFKGKELEEALGVLAGLASVPGLYGEADYIRADVREFVLRDGTVVIYGGRFGSREARRIWRVRRMLTAGTAYVIDVRFNGDVIVRNPEPAVASEGGEAGAGEG